MLRALQRGWPRWMLVACGAVLATVQAAAEDKLATLIVRNATEFNIDAVVRSDLGSLIPAFSIAPFSAATVAVRPGQPNTQVVATNMDVTGYPEATANAPMQAGGTYEIEFLRNSFQPVERTPCPQAVIGRWQWFVNGVAVFYTDGAVRQGDLTAAWSCMGDTVYIDWSHGYEDMLRLSPDAASMRGTGSSKDPAGPHGFAVWADKID